MGKLMDSKDNIIEENYDQRRIPMSPNVYPTSPLDLSINSRQYPFRGGSSSPTELSIKTDQFNYRQISVDDKYEPPEVLTQPKTDWHYRSMKDLAKKHLPYLPGIGPQRTPIRVRVPVTYDEQMYLAIAIRTIDNEPHLSKVIVPAKTHVNTQHLSHDNNLNCLQFDECNPADYFDQYKNHIYSEISSAEHQKGYKELRIHMFNLYQNRLITKEVIEMKQLNLCRLAFWLCIRVNEEYVAVSQPSFSSIIEEKKVASRSRVPTQLNQPTLISNPFAQFYIDYNDPNNTEDDDDDDSF